MRAIVIYYSLGGNTKRIARLISDRLGADMAEIETVQEYTGSYNDIVNQGQREVNKGFMPYIKPLSVDLSAYDTVILGSPVWWYTFAPAMKTFLSNADLSGKAVYAFATNGGWLGNTIEDFQNACAGADFRGGLDIRFDTKTLKTPEDKIIKWVDEIKNK